LRWQGSVASVRDAALDRRALARPDSPTRRLASTRSLRSVRSPGVFFLSLLAILIKSNYPYVGEWYNLEGEEGRGPMPYQEQKEVVVSALWQAVGVYLVAGVVSVLGLGWNRVRGR